MLFLSGGSLRSRNAWNRAAGRPQLTKFCASRLPHLLAIARGRVAEQTLNPMPAGIKGLDGVVEPARVAYGWRRMILAVHVPKGVAPRRRGGGCSAKRCVGKSAHSVQEAYRVPPASSIVETLRGVVELTHSHFAGLVTMPHSSRRRSLLLRGDRTLLLRRTSGGSSVLKQPWCRCAAGPHLSQK